MRILVTGATGFVGHELCPVLEAQGHEVIAIQRRPSPPGASRPTGAGPSQVVVADVSRASDWRPALQGVEAVVHLAALVDVMRDPSAAPLDAFRQVNVAGTLNLARQAAAAGVRRFVFLSSIKVNGEGGAVPYRETDAAAPQDPYAISKREAEQGLREIAAQSGMEVVILRPPLVYGAGVEANFLRLMQATASGWPLPFGRVENRRSLLYLGNLVDAIQLCLEHPAAAGKTYLLSDGEDVSTPELIRRLARAMGRPARLLPVPPAWFALAGRLLGKRQEVARLLGSLAVDSSLIRRELGWMPPYSLDAGLAETARHYAKSRMEVEPARR